MRIDALTARIWRHGVAFAIAFDAVQLVIRTRMRAPLASANLPVPQAFQDLAGSLPGLVALAAVTCAAAFAFARGRAPIAAGVVALASNRLLLEAFGALDGIYDETSYFASSAMLGWLFGSLFARALGEARGSTEIERFAGLGAAAMFGATYINAGTAKMHDSGLAWADGDTIRLLVLAHRPAGVPSWLDAVRSFAGQSAVVASAASIGTLVLQLGAVVFPWTRRTRLVWGSLFVAFHVGIHLVAGSIFFVQAVFLATLFAVPWPAAMARLRRSPSNADDPELPAPPSIGRRLVLASGVVVATLALLVALPIRPRAHPVERLAGTPAPAGPRREPIEAASLGPLSVGREIADGWILRRIVIDDDRAELVIGRAEGEVTLDVTARSAPRGRFDRGDLHLSYRETKIAFDAFSEAGESIARECEAAAGGRPLSEAFRGWIVAARGSR